MRSPPEGVSDNRDRNFLIMDKNPRLNFGTHLAQSARYGGKGPRSLRSGPFSYPYSQSTWQVNSRKFAKRRLRKARNNRMEQISSCGRMIQAEGDSTR
jgi:hypothetical protein